MCSSPEYYPGRSAQVTLSLNVERLNLELPYLRTKADVDSAVGE